MSDVSSGKTEEAIKKVFDVLNLILALKDAYMEIRRQLHSGRKVSRRATQMHSNLLAVLEADKKAHELGDAFEAGEDDHHDRPHQLDLPLNKVDLP